jgi:AraC-like DNA-binding protein
MFCNNRKLAFILKGVFLVNLSEGTAKESGRKYSALSLRLNGNASFLCNGQEYSLRSGSVVYIPKGVDYIRTSNENETLLTVHFETFGQEESDIQIIDGCESLHPFFETLHTLWIAKDYNKCLRTVYKIFDELIPNISDLSSSFPATISAGVAYINENFRSPEASSAQAASLCHVSETYFRRIFTEHFKISPISTLLDLRFNYAKGLLRSGYYQIKEVAALSGFSDTKYFRTAFKKRYGQTPNEYAAAYSEK